ncbi:MAG: xanthine dehydrogenase family protein molybdopterin-binding subunit [Gemmatimonadaceae bacterium]|nr:xanthine dehydrogenase family protein molybdopterin-binding subunit [Acetobacteraceae bacterium]
MSQFAEATGAQGRSMPRVDAVQKVLGATRYTADAPALPGLLHAAWVGSQVARGRIRGANLDSVGRMPGVSMVLTHLTMPRLAPPPEAGKPAWFGENTAPMQDDRVHYLGQPIAVVLAATPEQADHAARALRVTFEAEPPVLGLDGPAAMPELFSDTKLQVTRGAVAAGLANSPVRIEETYDTVANHHAPIELPSAVAAWTGDRLDLWVTSRGVVQMRTVVSHAFGLPDEHVVIRCPFVGGAFGAKGWLFDHALLTAAASRVAGRPVRLVLTREQMFESQGRRAIARQMVALGASREGTLGALRHDSMTQTSEIAMFAEKCGAVTPHLYAVPALQVSHRVSPANVSSPTPMRGPGEAPGSFAVEVAMDELAVKLGMDPVELRRRNLPRDGDPASGKPWTSFNLDECWRRGTEMFGWAARDGRPGVTRDGEELVGLGCATAAYPADRRKASAAAALLRDGTVEVRIASHDAGHGTYTALTILAAQTLEIAPDRVKVLLGSTEFPPATVSGGSTTLASTGPAVIAACQALQSRLAALTAAADPLRNDWVGLLRRDGLDRIEASAQTDAGTAEETHGVYSFGAHFVEVRVHPVLCRVRVTRYAGVFDVGRVLAPVQARSQIVGGVVFGLGMALMEHGMHDASGRLATTDLGSYHVPSCADAPARFDVDFIDQPDTRFNPMGTRGVGEIASFGTGAAIANAVFHACGKRVRQLPITAETLL